MVVRELFASYMKDSKIRFWSLIALLVIVVGGSWYAYRVHTRNYEQKAQLALVQGIEALARAQSEDSVEHMWKSAEQVLSEGFRRYGHSSYAPYFLLFQSDAALGQGDQVRAQELVEQSLELLPVKAPLYQPLQIRVALQSIDSSDEAVRAQGEKALVALAEDQDSPYYPMALYYQGLLAFEAGDRTAAEKVWAPFIAGSKHSSVWGELVSAKLAYQL